MCSKEVENVVLKVGDIVHHLFPGDKNGFSEHAYLLGRTCYKVTEYCKDVKFSSSEPGTYDYYKVVLCDESGTEIVNKPIPSKHQRTINSEFQYGWSFLDSAECDKAEIEKLNNIILGLDMIKERHLTRIETLNRVIGEY